MANFANKNNKLLPIKLILIVAAAACLALDIDTLRYFISLCCSMIKTFLTLARFSFFPFYFYSTLNFRLADDNEREEMKGEKSK